MALPVSIPDIISLVSKGVKLYQKIAHDAPEEIKAVGRRMSALEFYLHELKSLIDNKKRHSLAKLRPNQTKRLEDIMKDIHSDSSEVYKILQIWDQSGSFARALFAVGGNPGELKELSGKIEVHKQDLRDILQLMGLFAIQPFLPNAPANLADQPPEPPQPEREYTITFIDPNNFKRSKVAEGYMKLVREWTVHRGGKWQVKYVHSAGIDIKDRSDCVDILQSMKGPIVMYDGNKPPNNTAMASLFDNKFFNYPYKAGIKGSMLNSRSRGITQDIFKNYDYILVFVGREYERLLRFKQALIAAKGPAIAPGGKGRIIHLGAYLGKDGKANEIWDAPKDKDGSDSRANWNNTTSQIKLATKAFLRNELDWVQPTK